MAEKAAHTVEEAQVNMKTNNMMPSRQLNSGTAMTNQVIRKLHAGWVDHVEEERIAKLKQRALQFSLLYTRAKKCMAQLTSCSVRYQADGWAEFYLDSGYLSSLSGLKSFKQTGSITFEHFTRNMLIYIPTMHGDNAYLEMNLPALMKAKNSGDDCRESGMEQTNNGSAE